MRFFFSEHEIFHSLLVFEAHAQKQGITVLYILVFFFTIAQVVT